MSQNPPLAITVVFVCSCKMGAASHISNQAIFIAVLAFLGGKKKNTKLSTLYPHMRWVDMQKSLKWEVSRSFPNLNFTLSVLPQFQNRKKFESKWIMSKIFFESMLLWLRPCKHI